MQYVILNRSDLYNRFNDAGEGYAVGGDDSDINDLAEEVGGELVHCAHIDDDIAVYSVGSGVVLVGNPHRPWAVAV